MKNYLLPAILGLTLVGCGSDSDNDNNNTPQQPADNKEQPAPAADKEAPNLSDIKVELQPAQDSDPQAKTKNYLISGTVTDNKGIETLVVSVAGKNLTVTLDGDNFSQLVTLAEGPQTITITATDTSNNNSTDTQNLVVDTTAPVISAVFPANGHATQARISTVKGKVADASEIASVQIMMADQTVDASIAADGSFSARLQLNPGNNSYTVVAKDAANNKAESVYTTYFGKQVSGGNSHSAVIKNGKVYTWGRNNYGQNGLGLVSDPYKDLNVDQHPFAPKIIPGDTQFVSITYDQNTSVAMTANGQVYTWGYNKYGQLGLGTAGSETLNEEHKSAPTQIAAVTDAVAVTRGYDQTLILHADGSVSAFGRNRYGQLGDGTTDNRDMPTKISGLSNIVQIDAGGSFAIALDADGRMWSWGRNNYGQLGLGTIDSDPHSSPVQIPLEVKIEAISLGKGHALALARNGEVYGWGLNFSSQIGKYDRNNEDPDWPKDISSPKKLPWFSNARAVWANGNQSFAERADGKVYPWGQNMLGTLGIEQDGDVKEPASAVFGIENVIDLGNGALHTIAMRQDGNVFSWGWSFQGSLGGGSSTIDRWSYRVPVLLNLPEPSAE